ncbi:MAG: RHS repeat-associated core domain-containing protein [Phycisphaerae bacterium]
MTATRDTESSKPSALLSGARPLPVDSPTVNFAQSLGIADSAQPKRSTVTYTYTPDGKMDVRTWARQVGGQPLTTDYGYDSQTGELTSVNYSDSTPDVTRTYDRLGRLASVDDAVGHREFTFDLTLQPDLEKFNPSGGGLHGKILKRQYETPPPPGQPIPETAIWGRPKSLQVGSSSVPSADYSLNYLYDGYSRLWRVTGTGLPSYGAVYSYESGSDLVTQIDYKSSSTNTLASIIRTYESGRDLLLAVENKWGATQVSRYAYRNDLLGRRTDVVRTGSAFSAGHLDAWQYNSRNELKRSDRYNSTDPTNPTNADDALDRAFVYDSIGNRTSYVQGTSATTYYCANNLNQITTIDDTNACPPGSPNETMSYDLDGNLTQGILGGTLGGAGILPARLTWDAENRLTSVAPVSPASGHKKLVFDYDYMSRRVRKRAYDWNQALNGGLGDWNSTPSVDRKCIYDGWNALVELNGLSSDAVVRRYLWGLDLSGLNGSQSNFQAAGGIGGLLATRDMSLSKQYLYFFDANGNVGQLLDQSGGAIVAKYEYDAYGETTAKTGTYADSNPFRFSTKFLDAESGLYYYGYRYYWARCGRWVSRDPIGEFGGTNVVAFTYNAPHERVDPVGRNVFMFARAFSDSREACCQFHRTEAAPYVGGKSWYCLSQKLCSSRSSPEACCNCATHCRVDITGASWKKLVRAYWGKCCLCTIRIIDYGSFASHQDLEIDCKDSYLRVFRWSSANGWIGPAPIKFSRYKSNGNSVREKQVECSDAQNLMSMLQSKYPKSYGGNGFDYELECFPFEQCHTFAARYFDNSPEASWCD